MQTFLQIDEQQGFHLGFEFRDLACVDPAVFMLLRKDDAGC